MIPIPPELVDVLHRSRRIVVVTGAGISAESGVPTFRDALTGLWAQYEPAELATPEAFCRNPKLVWDWYCWRRQVVLGVAPNAGHRALAEWQGLRDFEEFLLVTQNVDGLHQQAGSQPIRNTTFKTRNMVVTQSRWNDISQNRRTDSDTGRKKKITHCQTGVATDGLAISK